MRNLFLLVGRGGGKTFLMKELILRDIANAGYMEEIYYIGPTNIQAKEIIWEVLNDSMTELGWEFRALVSKSRFELSGKRKIYVIGGEKISRIRGHHNVRMVCLDEFAYFSLDHRTVFKAIKDTLKRLKGRIIVSTTPNGIGTSAHDLYLNIENLPNWNVHHWASHDNVHVEDDDELFTLDEKGILEENEAIWVAPEDTAYYNFNENIHVTTGLSFNYSIPIKLCFDFNVNPTTILLTQYDSLKGVNYVIKEYSDKGKNSSTEKTVEKLCDDFEDKRGIVNFLIRGDAAGNSRHSSTGKSDYYYVKGLLNSYKFNHTLNVRRSNPAIIDRVKYVNGWLKPYGKEPKIIINKSCKELIKDLAGQELEGRKPSPKNNRGHKADALGYDIYQEEMANRQEESSTITL